MENLSYSPLQLTQVGDNIPLGVGVNNVSPSAIMNLIFPNSSSLVGNYAQQYKIR